VATQSGALCGHRTTWALAHSSRALAAKPQTPQVVLFASDDVKLALNTATMITAWALSEIIRYSFYACKVRTLHTHTHTHC
jgi:hypothetical protein